uniref:Uncharacterized protein n=1 Tax=Myotis myotis TaxID=51298 RepID=A0A7J7WVZ9_MYOMY|nr:hypothetical protein mMyoMyo1_011980 [Myotis myotis]
MEKVFVGWTGPYPGPTLHGFPLESAHCLRRTVFPDLSGVKTLIPNAEFLPLRYNMRRGQEGPGPRQPGGAATRARLCAGLRRAHRASAGHTGDSTLGTAVPHGTLSAPPTHGLHAVGSPRMALSARGPPS